LCEGLLLKKKKAKHKNQTGEENKKNPPVDKNGEAKEEKKIFRASQIQPKKRGFGRRKKNEDEKSETEGQRGF